MRFTRVLVASVALQLLALVGQVAARTDASSDTATLATDASALTEEVSRQLVTVLQANLLPGARRLVVMQGIDNQFVKVPLICDGVPAVVAHTPSLPNKQCFAVSKPDLANNLSCTCLMDLENKDEWVFKIKQNRRTGDEEMPIEQSSEIPIEIDSTMFYGVKNGVKKVVLEGVEDTPVFVTVIQSPSPNDQNVNIRLIYQGTANFKSLTVKNINLAANNPIVEDFVPSSIETLSMSSCGITELREQFVKEHPFLKELDLSGNQLTTFNQASLDASKCQTLNLSKNEFEMFPSRVLALPRLSTLDLTGNSLPNLTFTVNEYNSIKQIPQLQMDAVTPSDACINGTLQSLSEAKVCVLNATTEAPPAPAPTSSDSSSNSSYLMYIVIGGCLLIAVLVFLLVKRNNCRSRDEPGYTKEPLDAYFDNTLSYEDTHATISASLLNDPIIITNRLPYKDIRVANCVSKGGFGLVYSGVYNRRRVAIKKIRPDRAGDIKQIESFLKEICLIATLNHPRVVEFIGVSWDTLRNLCAVTEFMERGDLREVLHGFKLRNMPLTWESHKTTIALHIAEGLTYLHSLSPKIVHRDLKSKNVLLNGEMVAKLADFGISRERHIEETHMTAGIGTSFWIAPEVLLGKDYDERADIFSFGVVLSEIDTDDYPYWNASNPNVGNKAQENMILQMVASGAMRPSFSETCPQAILELADLCLHVEPANRPTAAEVAYKLQQIVQFMNPAKSTQ